MTDAKEVKRIVDKYNMSMYELSENATAKEFKTVIKYIADQANLKQRKIAGLDKEDKKNDTIKLDN
ncbi:MULTISPECIES: hypothetical protein [Enterococcus]|uniref:hypothetical protein n=1 Tax=Enterococcus TaxID=1350 RepID=UPI0022217A48|nr:hypothetical protein [Enterococcus faecium]MCW1819211.1 hypothetical protein [Enterococcus faecium]